MAGHCTLRELEEYYSIDDLEDMHEALEVKYHYEQKAMQKTEKQ